MRNGGTEANRAFVLPQMRCPGFIRRSERITATVKHLHCLHQHRLRPHG
jgi:hypothetical protein